MSEAFAAHNTPPVQYEKFTPPRMREYVRTPSPTPSERRALDDDGKPHISALFKKENWKVILILIVVCALGILMAVYHDQIVDALKPAANWMYRTPGGWLVPIAVLIVLSIPPLFGHEIVVILIGLTWGLGVGFGIAAAGTIIGELGTFFAFSYCLKGRAEKYEEKQIRYALIARIIRDGGLKMAIVARYSVIPSHLLTALFTTCGMTLITFLISAVVSLPKQFVAVYLGYALAQAQGQESKSSKIAKYITVAITVIVTLAAMHYMRGKQNAVKDQVIYERRKRRQARLAGAPVLAQAGSSVPGEVDVEQYAIHSRIDSEHTRVGSEGGHPTLSGPDSAFKGAGHAYQSVPLHAPEPTYPPSATMNLGPATMRSMDDLGALPQPNQPAFELPNPHAQTSPPPAGINANQGSAPGNTNYTNV